MDSILDAGDRRSGLDFELNGFGGHFNKDVKAADDGRLIVTVHAVATGKEAIDIDNVFEETPLCRHLTSLVGLQATHCG
jgi:hypothetical protein